MIKSSEIAFLLYAGIHMISEFMIADATVNTPCF